MSVGFALSSPYWQYQIVCLKCVSNSKLKLQFITFNFLNLPLGFSIYQYLGFNLLIICIVYLTIAMPVNASSVLGVWSLCQWCPILATLK